MKLAVRFHRSNETKVPSFSLVSFVCVCKIKPNWQLSSLNTIELIFITSGGFLNMATIFGINLPDVSLKIFILLHFCLLMFCGWGLPLPYHISNYAVLGLGFWMLSDKANTTASLFFATFVAATAAGDVLLMIFFHISENLNGNMKFSLFMTCMNLFLKPATFIYGFSEHKRRAGDSEGSGYTNFDSDVSPTYLPDHIAPPIPGVDIGNPV